MNLIGFETDLIRQHWLRMFMRLHDDLLGGWRHVETSGLLQNRGGGGIVLAVFDASAILKRKTNSEEEQSAKNRESA